MASNIQNVSLTAPTDYSAEGLSIERRRRLAEQLYQQSQEPLQTNQTAGGYVIPVSPLAGLAKALNQGIAGYGMAKADKSQRDLAAKYQSDLTNTLARAQALGAGTPASPYDATEFGGDSGMNPAVAPDRQGMIAALMGHPATQPFGMAEYSKDLNDQRRQALLQSLGIGTASASPQQALGAEMAAGGQAGPTNAAAGSVGALNSGFLVDPTASGLIAGANGDPALSKLGELQQAAALAARKPVVNRGFGIGTMTGPGGSYVPDPASTTQAASTAGAVEGAKRAASVPYSMEQMDVPVYLPGGDQINVKMNATQAHNYQVTGQLPPKVAASIPGYQQPGAPQPTAAPPVSAPQRAANPASAITPQREADRLRILRDELKNFPNDPDLKAEIARAEKSVRAVVGRTQSQGEQITQQRQQAGGKTVDEAFAKDYVSFTTGGAQDMAKQLSQLRDVTTALAQPDANLTGPVLGRVPDAIKSFTNPKSIAMRERVEEVVQRSLRAILGAQFTEKEGERLIARAYNPNQPESENAIRVGRLYTQLQKAYQSKLDAAQYFEKTGTLQGWEGKLPSMADFNPDGGASGTFTRRASDAPSSIRSQADAILNGNR